jgi:isopentenyl diphosphate isomerase/L-lactate dehydrogenase-like FMN-dependent dehydrogenase
MGARSTANSVETARRAARRCLPPSIYGYIDGGKEAESTAVANELAFSRVLFSPKVGCGVTDPDMGVTVLGQRIAMPVVIAPTGFIRIVHTDGEFGVARAAAAMGIPMALSHVCSVPVGRVCEINPDTWFQLYMLDGRNGAASAMELARQAGCRVLVVTVDVAAVAPSDRSGRRLPSSLGIGEVLRFLPEAVSRPHWLASFLRGGLTMLAPNAPRKPDGRPYSLAEIGSLIVRTPPTWDDLAWIRQRWAGSLVLKGILRVDDAERAVALGADAISVSNHGAKVLDGTPAAIAVLPEIVDAVGHKMEVLLDGGVRRGADVVRACALGAKAVLIGRSYLWGLAAGGERGVADILALFRRGIRATLADLGCPSIDQLNRTWLRPLPSQSQWNELSAVPDAVRRRGGSSRR